MPALGIGRTTRGGVTLTMTFHMNWNGEQFKKKVNKANEAAVMKAAEETMIAAKQIVHVVSGTLRRSIKVDRPDEVRDRTEEAKNRDLGHPIPRPAKASTFSGGTLSLAVGGTTFYALYEELLHPYMEPAVNRSGMATKIYAAAKAEF